MDKLPQELIDAICDFLSADLQSSKSLRLAGHRFSRTTQHVFNSLLIYQHPDKWENINRIARFPALAKHVHSIRLVRERPLPLYRFLEHSQPSTVNQQGRWIPYGDYANREGQDRKHTAHHYWARGYLEVEKWYRRLYCHGDRSRCPPMHLEKLPNLENVETVSNKTLQHLNAHASPSNGLTRQEQETGQKLPWSYLHMEYNAHLDVFLMACQYAGKTITRLSLHNVFELVSREITLPIRLDCLLTLEIDLTTQSRTRYDDTTIAKSNLTRFTPLTHWIRSMRSVKTLSVTQVISSRKTTDPRHKIVTSFDIVGILSQGTFPALESLRLKHIITPESTLRLFLRLHRNPLVNLTIDEPLISRSQWNGLRQAIYDGLASNVFHPTESSSLNLTDSFFELHPDHSKPQRFFPRPPAGSNYWVDDD